VVNTVIRWRYMTDYPAVRPNGTRGNSEGLSVVLNNRLYVFGGYERNTFRPQPEAYYYDPTLINSLGQARGDWVRLPNMPRGNTHAGIATDGRYIYIVSGYLANDQGSQTFGTRHVYRFDPEGTSTETAYSRMPDLPQNQAAGVAAVIGNHLYYVGGTNSTRTQELGNLWRLDLSNPNATWEARAALPNPRHHMGVAVYNDRMYIIGGQHDHDNRLVSQDDVHMYDPATDTWTQLADLPEARNHIGATTMLLGSRIYVLGGQFAHEDARDTVFVYDIPTNTWFTQQDAMPLERHSSVGGVINGRLYLSTGSFSWLTIEGRFEPAPSGSGTTSPTSVVAAVVNVIDQTTIAAHRLIDGASAFYCAPDLTGGTVALIDP
jgi:N-acetylneuraminic acid mutarotase